MAIVRFAEYLKILFTAISSCVAVFAGNLICRDCLFCHSNIGVILSLDNIAKMTRVKNLMTVKNYLGYLEDSFCF